MLPAGRDGVGWMARYAVGRLFQLALVLVGISATVFLTMHVLPGDTAQLLLGEHATAEQLARLRGQLGLDQPVWVQYGRFMVQLAQGDLGLSVRNNHPALREVLVAFPVTLQLTLSALLLATAAGVPLGVLSSLRPGGALDNAVMTLTLFGVSMPVFWLGLMLLLVFGAALGWLPVGGLLPIGVAPPRLTGMSVVDSVLSGDPALVGTSLRYLLLPAVTLATIPLALITRITRAEMLAAATLDHVRTAHAKGLPVRRVVLRHVLRNALTPVLTVVGLQFGLLLSGAVLTETIFALPGLGRLMVDSILSRDYPVVQAGTLFIAALFVGVNLLVDLGYGVLDPRIRRA
jgi:peptide/nickel transport system permease protein